MKQEKAYRTEKKFHGEISRIFAKDYDKNLSGKEIREIGENINSMLLGLLDLHSE